MKLLRPLLILTCLLMPLLAQAQSPAKAAALGETAVKTRSLTFEQLGTGVSMPLRGAGSNVGVRFSVRQDELVLTAALDVAYMYSPSMIDELSHIKVYLNEEIVGLLPINKAEAGKKVTKRLNLDSALISDYNNIRMELVGHYVLDHCENPQHGSLWVDISGRSSLTLSVQPLPLANDLALFPRPFFDERDASRMTLPFVFASQPSLETLDSAAIVSSWFGARADWRGARFPIFINKRPDRHAIVMATANDLPEFLAEHVAIEGPTLEMISLPLPPLVTETGEVLPRNHRYIKLLLVLGRDQAELKTAAEALVLSQALMSGQKVLVENVDIGEPREPYDAPRWVRLDRPTKFGEMVNDPTELQVAGHRPETIRVNLRIPADLFTWRSRGVPVDLKYRYTPMLEEDESRLNVSINNEFVEAFNLLTSGFGGVKKRVRVPLITENLFDAGNEFFIPAFKLGSNNQLQFDFSFGYPKQEMCKTDPVDSVRAAIDADSSIDLSGFPHFAALPNLGFYVNSGFPFTVHADLAKTTVILPEQPDMQELETLLTLVGRFGVSTGYPAMRLTLSYADQFDLKTDHELLIIGTRAHQTLMQRWQQELPSSISSLSRELGLPTRTVNMVNDWFGFDTTPDPRPASEVLLQSHGALAGMLGFESPQAAGRSVVSVLGTDSKQLLRVLDVLDDSYQVSQVNGSTVMIRPHSIESFLVGDTYTTGNLPFMTRVWYFLSDHPVIMAILTIFSVIVIGFLLWRALLVVVSQRMHQDAH